MEGVADDPALRSAMLEDLWDDPKFEALTARWPAPRPGAGIPAASPTSSSGCSDRWAEGQPHANDEPGLISRTPVATQWPVGRFFITHSGDEMVYNFVE
jgi:hypothetical protein